MTETFLYPHEYLVCFFIHFLTYFGIIVRTRLFYTIMGGFSKKIELDGLVIVVGNLTMGGTVKHRL